MSWIDTIRKKNHEEKARLIWIATGIAAVLLIALWVLTSRIPKRAAKDTTLFQTIGRGIRDIGEQYRK